MKVLIIPRGAVPRLYRKMVASGEIKGQYKEIAEKSVYGPIPLLDVMNAQAKERSRIDARDRAKAKASPARGAEQAGKDIAQAAKAYAAGRKTPKKKAKIATGYQDGNRGYDNGGR